jgi:hypothetical protein
MIKNFQVDIQDIQTFKVLYLYLELIPIKWKRTTILQMLCSILIVTQYIRYILFKQFLNYNWYFCKFLIKPNRLISKLLLSIFYFQISNVKTFSQSVF